MTVGKGFKVAMLNVRSLWPNLEEVKIHLSDFDIIGICETWLDSSVTTEMLTLLSIKL